MGYLARLFKKKTAKTVIPGISQASIQSTNQEGTRYIPGELHKEAEALKKAGYLEGAESKYLQSISCGEATEGWKKHGPAPAMYEALAKLYYHTGRDKKAIDILDRYLKLADKIGVKKPNIETLRERMARGTFRRVNQRVGNVAMQGQQDPQKKPEEPREKTQVRKSEVRTKTEEAAEKETEAYYVYAHKDSNGNVFYIGKGKKDRAWRTHAKSPVWKKYVEKNNGVFSVEILKYGLNENEALRLERNFIAHYGQSLINWEHNLGSGQDLKAIEHYWSLRKENEKNIAKASTLSFTK